MITYEQLVIKVKHHEEVQRNLKKKIRRNTNQYYMRDFVGQAQKRLNINTAILNGLYATVYYAKQARKLYGKHVLRAHKG